MVNWLDIILILILATSVIVGFVRGFARVAIGLVAVIAGIICGIWFYGTAGSFLRPYVSSPGIANFIGFLLVFFGLLALGAGIGRLLAKIFKWAGLRWLDRLMGGAFGFVRGLLVAIALVMALLAFAPKPPPRAVVHSQVAPYVVDAAHMLAAIAPHELKEGCQRSYDEVKKIWAEAMKTGVRRLPAEKI